MTTAPTHRTSQGGSLVVGLLLALFLPPVGLLVAQLQLILNRRNRRWQYEWVPVYLAGWVMTLLMVLLIVRSW